MESLCLKWKTTVSLSWTNGTSYLPLPDGDYPLQRRQGEATFRLHYSVYFRRHG